MRQLYRVLLVGFLLALFAPDTWGLGVGGDDGRESLTEGRIGSGLSTSAPGVPSLDPTTKARLLDQAVERPDLAPWQRAYMQELAKGSPGAPVSMGGPQGDNPAVNGSPADGTWTRLVPHCGPTARVAHTAAYDALRNRMIVFGGFEGPGALNDVWALSLGPVPSWSSIFPTGTAPTPRWSTSAVYDPVRDRVLIFGGLNDSERYNDTWALNLSAGESWEFLSTPDAPQARGGHIAVYDPVRDQMVIFGGDNGIGWPNVNDTWALSLGGALQWTELAQSGSRPAARASHSGIYDPVRQRLVVYGGWSGGGPLGDSWAMNLDGTPAWTQLAPAGPTPAPRLGHIAAYDSARDRMVIYGGDSYGELNDIWAMSFAGNGTWLQLQGSGNQAPSKYLASAVYDPLGDRVIVFGGNESGQDSNSTWSLAFTSPAIFRNLEDLAGRPSGRIAGTSVYDPVRNRMLVFCGWDAVTALSDVWALSFDGEPAWSQLTPTGTGPSPRWSLAAIYDPLRDRVLIFGGLLHDNRYNDLFALNLSGSPAWEALTAGGSLPTARGGHTAIYDPVRDRMVIYGGDKGPGVTPNLADAWALDLSGPLQWAEITPLLGVFPDRRASHSAIYDPIGDRMVVFGGWNGYQALADTWTLALGTSAWSQLTTAGSTPAARLGHVAVFDPLQNRMILFGGNNATDLAFWVLTLGASPTWSQLPTSGFPIEPRYLATAVYDSKLARMVTFGGVDPLNAPRNDTFVLDLGFHPFVTEISPLGNLPVSRGSHVAAYDPLRKRMIVLCGHDGVNPLDDVWSLSMNGDPRWMRISPTGPGPSPRWSTSVVYDPLRDRLLLFGGVLSNSRFDDVWALNLAGVPAWEQLAPAGTLPTARGGHTAIYDPVRDQMVIFGGDKGPGGIPNLSDTWALSLGDPLQWTQLSLTGSLPGRRAAHTAIYDPVRDRMVVHGGWSGGSPLSDTWSLTLSGIPAWTAMSPSGSIPPRRLGHTAVYDPMRDRMVIHAGDSFGQLSDTWALSFAGGETWTQLDPSGSPAPRRYVASAVYDPDGDRMIVFGGYDGDSNTNETWVLWSSAPADAPQSMIGADAGLRLLLPNPYHSNQTITLSASRGGEAEVVLYNVLGQKIRTLLSGRIEAGQHGFSWDGCDDDGSPVGTGVYYAKIRVDKSPQNHKIVYMR